MTQLRSFRPSSSVVEHFLGKEEVAVSITALGSSFQLNIFHQRRINFVLACHVGLPTLRAPCEIAAPPVENLELEASQVGRWLFCGWRGLLLRKSPGVGLLLRKSRREFGSCCASRVGSSCCCARRLGLAVAAQVAAGLAVAAQGAGGAGFRLRCPSRSR